jgi:hypothetical protein
MPGSLAPTSVKLVNVAPDIFESLLSSDDPGIERMNAWLKESVNAFEVLPPSDDRGSILISLQVTTRSTLGAIVHETGGILVDSGWLRFRGSGNQRLPRSPALFTEGGGFMLVADDAVGGFFAINGGTFGSDLGNLYYWAPDDIDWEPLEIGYTDFFVWSLSSQLAQFYEDLRWPSWRQDLEALSGDQCFSFYPFLWSQQGSVTESHRSAVPVSEAFDAKVSFLEQMHQP